MLKHSIYIVILFICIRCAQITPLTGGKKDTTPPKALAYYPQNASINFKYKTIQIVFDEYISLKSISTQFIITPQMKQAPDIQANGKTLKITFTEPLSPNTTYKLFFGDAIVDLHESNILKNFEYVFSTGDKIDSSIVRGQVLDANFKKPVSSALVGLYNDGSNDSIIYKEKPLYISRTNTDGYFTFNYLPNASFKIAAINDKNNNLQYDGSEEEIGFQEKQVQTADSNLTLLYLFKENPSKSFIKKSTSVEYGQAIVVYNKSQNDITSVLSKQEVQYKLNKLKDTVTIYYKNTFDTLLLNIQHQNNKIDTVYIKVPSKKVFTYLVDKKIYKYAITSNIQAIMPYFGSLGLNINFPVTEANISKSKINLYEHHDSVHIKKEYKMINQRNENTSFIIESDFKPETQYLLKIDSAALFDDTGRYNDSINYTFTTSAKEDYAKLTLKLFFPKKENYLVYLLNDKEQIVQETKIEFSLTTSSEKKIEYEHLFPGNYFIKIVEDTNKNNAFDTGIYLKHQQAEPVFINLNPIKLLAGWEIENEWIVK